MVPDAPYPALIGQGSRSPLCCSAMWPVTMAVNIRREDLGRIKDARHGVLDGTGGANSRV